MNFNKIKIKNYILSKICKRKFYRNLFLLTKTGLEQFTVAGLKEILITEDEKYLLEFAKKIQAKEFGTYYYSDCTVEVLELNKFNIEEYFNNIIKNEIYRIFPIIVSIVSILISILK